jgi:hypothetical protein
VSSEHLAWALVAALALLVLLQSLRLAIVRGAAARRLALARKRGREGERAALALIERAGYRIEALQPALEWSIVCDGEPLPIALRADMLVSRAGRRFVAEVKTGAGASRLETPTTRRQLLEYSIAYGVDGALLVDMERDCVHEVSFPSAPPRGGQGGRLLAALLVLASAWLIAQLVQR